jgi:predicted Na+-dependent transporter
MISSVIDWLLDQSAKDILLAIILPLVAALVVAVLLPDTVTDRQHYAIPIAVGSITIVFELASFMLRKKR